MPTRDASNIKEINLDLLTSQYAPVWLFSSLLTSTFVGSIIASIISIAFLAIPDFAEIVYVWLGLLNGADAKEAADQGPLLLSGAVSFVRQTPLLALLLLICLLFIPTLIASTLLLVRPWVVALQGLFALVGSLTGLYLYWMVGRAAIPYATTGYWIATSIEAMMFFTIVGLIARGAIGFFRLDPVNRRFMSEVNRDGSWMEIAAAALRLPYFPLKNARLLPTIIAAFLFFASSLTLATLVFSITQFPKASIAEMKVFRASCIRADERAISRSACIQKQIKERYEPPFGYLVATIAVSLFYIFFANALYGIGRLIARPAIIKTKASNDDPPIVFLRSFRKEAIRLSGPKDDFLFRLLSFGRPRTSIDSLVLEECAAYGRVVAIGNPTDWIAPYGPSRQYIGAGDWKSEVTKLICHAKLIIVFVDETDGIQWELSEIFRLGRQSSCFFLIAPGYQPPSNDLLRLSEITRQSSAWPVLGCMASTSQGDVAFYGYKRNWMTYMIAIRMGLRFRYPDYA